MSNVSKKTNIFFKDVFTLQQYAAFSLSFNRAKDQHEKLKKTHHFRKIYQQRNQKPYPFGQISQGQNKRQPYLLDELRNYFSHYDSAWPEEKLKEPALAEELKFLVYEAIAILEGRNTKLDDNEKKEKEIKETLNKMREEPLKFFPLDSPENIQPTLALIASLFLTRSQMSFLAGKFFRGKGLDRDSVEHLARFKALKTLSQNDRVLIESNSQANGQDESFLSSKKEAGYAIWGRLEAFGLYDDAKDKKVIEEFPEDIWFIKQLILYLEHTQALPSVEFARTETEEQSNQLAQKIVFNSQNRKNPLRIRHNTIEAKVKLNGQLYRTNFGIHTLKYLVTAHLFDMDINDLVKAWLSGHQTRKGRKQKAFGAAPERIEKHITRLTDKYSNWKKREIKLYEQIRWICQFLNKAWNKKHNKYMDEREFKDFQQKTRHYRKDSLRTELEEKNLLDISGLGLGQKDDKTLGSIILKNRIQEVFKDMLTAHINWLTEQKQRLSKLSSEDLSSLAYRLNLRNIEKKSSKDNLRPVAMSSEFVKKEIEKKTGNSKRFFNHIRELSRENPLLFCHFGLEKNDAENKKAGWGKGKARERWARVGLLLKMIPKLMEQEDLKVLGKKPSKEDIEKRLNDKITIKFKLTQGWRNYAHFKNRQLIKLIEAYHQKNFTGSLPLLDANSSKNQSSEKAVSVQSLRQSSNKERFLLMQAMLQWEKDRIKKLNMQRENEKNYIPFGKILQASDMPDNKKLTKMRNACMHEDIAEERFSKPPEPLKNIYDTLERRAEEKKRNQKKEAIKRGHKEKQKR